MSAPSAAPDEVIADTIYSDSVQLFWRPPAAFHHNGDIIGYNVTYTAVNSETVDSILSASNWTVIGSLNPFTTYTVTVAAVTSAGRGPYSIAVTFMTDEAGIFLSLWYLEVIISADLYKSL